VKPLLAMSFTYKHILSSQLPALATRFRVVRFCDTPCPAGHGPTFSSGQTQSCVADHIYVIARSAATKQSQSIAWEIASLRCKRAESCFLARIFGCGLRPRQARNDMQGSLLNDFAFALTFSFSGGDG
jgi:hypothetical protein